MSRKREVNIERIAFISFLRCLGLSRWTSFQYTANKFVFRNLKKKKKKTATTTTTAAAAVGKANNIT